MAERTPANPADYSGADYIRFICGACQDFRVVAGPEGIAGSIPCPACGTDEQRRELFLRNKSMPQIGIADLTDEEADLFRQWRFRGHHELDCYRWIEGRRYKPEDDKEFLAEVEIRLAAWRKARDEADAEYRKSHPYSIGDARLESKNPPLHHCMKCGAACDEQTLFCPPCWEKHKKARKAAT